MKNRHGLLVDACLTLADGHAERGAALHMIEPRADRPTAITLGADKAYDSAGASMLEELSPHLMSSSSFRDRCSNACTCFRSSIACLVNTPCLNAFWFC